MDVLFLRLFSIVTLPSNMAVLKFGTSSPADTSPLKELDRAGHDSKDNLAVLERQKLLSFCLSAMAIHLA